MKEGKVNQQYLADQLGLSVTTVSRCFTNHPKIKPGTRAKVLQLATELGYSYNAFRNQKNPLKVDNRTVAVLVGVSPDNADAAGVAGKIFAGISQKAAALDFQVKIYYVNPSEFVPNMNSRRIIPNSTDNNLAGIILVFPFREETVKALSSRFHVTSVLDEYEELFIDSINPDDGRGIACMVRKLKDLGHRKFGFFSWFYPDVDTPWVERRMGSYFEHLYRYGLEFDQDRIIRIDSAEAQSTTNAADLVIEHVEKGMTALVCAADHQAYELIVALKEKGVRVPEDLSITGYDGIPVPIGMSPLTTYNSHFHEIGVSGMISIQRRIDHPLANRRHVLVDGDMIEGTTTAIPKNL